jgi:hypothetical protein
MIINEKMLEEFGIVLINSKNPKFVKINSPIFNMPSWQRRMDRQYPLHYYPFVFWCDVAQGKIINFVIEKSSIQWLIYHMNSLEENMPCVLWAHKLDNLLHLGLIWKATESKAITLSMLLLLLATMAIANNIPIVPIGLLLISIGLMLLIGHSTAQSKYWQCL